MKDRELAIAEFLALPDGPLVKRARRDDGLDGGDRRLSVNWEVEEDAVGNGREYRQRGFLDTDGEYARGGRGKVADRDIEMEDIELAGIEREMERGLWTYHGGNSILR